MSTAPATTTESDEPSETRAGWRQRAAAARVFLRQVGHLVDGHRTRYALATVAMIGAGVASYCVPLVPQVLIDGVIEPSRGEDAFAARVVALVGGRDVILRHFWVAGLVAVGFAGLAALCTHARGRLAARATEAIVHRLRARLYDRIQRAPVPFLDRQETGDLVQRCTSDVETVRMFLTNQVVEIGRALVMLVVPLPLMLAMSPTLTLVALALVPFIVAFAIVFFMSIKRAFREVEEAESRTTSALQENLTGIRVVRAFARQDFERLRFAERMDHYRRKDMRMYELMGGYFAISDFLCFAQRGLVLAIGAVWVAQGTIQVGTLFFFIAAITLFIWPVRHMGRVLTDLGKAVVALDRIELVLSTPTEAELDERAGIIVPTTSDEPPSRDGVRARVGRVEVRDVHFSHQGIPVLRGVDFSVEPGKTLAIMGASGSGKTTIVQLLLRFYEPDSGEIRLDGEPISRMARNEVRKRIAVVLQEPFLFSKTLRQNLLLGRESGSEDEVLAATEAAAVHESIVRLSQGYDTPVGERGVTLSGGQRQRVALARALLQEPDVLILDDALSAVDVRTEDLILRALRERRGRHTTIVIAHRISTLAHADEIVVLDHGRVSQRGTHQELLEVTDGVYARLWRIQTETAAEESGQAADRTEVTA